jgi:hypothetical protein
LPLKPLRARLRTSLSFRSAQRLADVAAKPGDAGIFDWCSAALPYSLARPAKWRDYHVIRRRPVSSEPIGSLMRHMRAMGQHTSLGKERHDALEIVSSKDCKPSL